MTTLVKCLDYSKSNLIKASNNQSAYLSLKDYFPDSVIRGEFRVSALPFEVLQQTLYTHYLEEYLGVKPWVVDVSKRRGYLEISECEEEKVDGTIKDLLNEKDFFIARRPYELTSKGASDLAESIMQGLSSDNIAGIFIRDRELCSVAYSDVLGVLGKSVSLEKVNQMLLEQYQRLEDFEMEQKQRGVCDWNTIAHQVFGGEI